MTTGVSFSCSKRTNKLTSCLVHVLHTGSYHWPVVLTHLNQSAKHKRRLWLEGAVGVLVLWPLKPLQQQLLPVPGWIQLESVRLCHTLTAWLLEGSEPWFVKSPQNGHSICLAADSRAGISSLASGTCLTGGVCQPWRWPPAGEWAAGASHPPYPLTAPSATSPPAPPRSAAAPWKSRAIRWRVSVGSGCKCPDLCGLRRRGRSSALHPRYLQQSPSALGQQRPPCPHPRIGTGMESGTDIGSGTHQRGRRGSRTPAPPRGPRRSTAAGTTSPRPAPPVGGQRPSAAPAPYRPGPAPPASPRPPIPYHQRRLRVLFVHGGGRAAPAPARRGSGGPSGLDRKSVV